ncbi:MAG: transporter substrate-binding domain-containing protein, partial [Planctomycetes bacterium]|nr:transporter substrate-binding domain-containing protein [Planctomycetota bacterium]
MKTNVAYASVLLTLHLLVAARPAPAQEQEQVQALSVTRPAGELVFVGSDRNEPYSFLDREGRIAGFDVDVMAAIAKRIGRKITVKLMPSEQAIEAVLAG